MKNKYDAMTNDDEFDLLAEILDDVGIRGILSNGDVFSILREEYNNDILELWEKKHPEYVDCPYKDECKAKCVECDKCGAPEKMRSENCSTCANCIWIRDNKKR